ncbi:MAG: hypothetical protein KGP14_03000 [Betaproteobacteria bacterium]|nr:hypothetical protein [Betaproteobacteria bacterium]
MHSANTMVLLAPLLTGLIGFAAHRASLCTVRGVAEVITSRRAWMLASFAKAAAWTALVAGGIAYFSPTSASPVLESIPPALGLLGGFLFGVGAGQLSGAIGRSCGCHVRDDGCDWPRTAGRMHQR